MGGIERGTVTEVSGPFWPLAWPRRRKKNHLVAGVHIEKKWAIPMLRTLGDSVNNQGLLRALAPLGEASSAVLVANLGNQTQAKLEFHFPDANRARPAVDAVQDGLVLLRVLVVDHVIGMLDEQMEGSRDEKQEKEVLFGKVIFEEIEPALRQTTVNQQEAVVYASAVVRKLPGEHEGQKRAAVEAAGRRRESPGEKETQAEC